MSILTKLINKEVLISVGFVTLAFLSLFLFFDFVDELQFIGRFGNNYQLRHALQYSLLQVPSHVYELLPITVLIGSVFVMARLAESSEFTILRTSGLGPWRALKQLLGLGFVFAFVTLAIGDYVSPMADRTGQLIKARFQGVITTGLTGAWLREKQGEDATDKSVTVNIASMNADTQMSGIRITEFDGKGNITALIQAKTAVVNAPDGWMLSGVETTRFSGTNQAQTSDGSISRTAQAQQLWKTDISSDMVAAALLKPERMRTLELYQYMRHLKANGQASQQFEIAFWRKLFYPLGCVVMVILALPFAYLHFRSGGITGYVFMGVLIGISFFLLNNMFGYIGNLNDWEPWVAASIPSVLYLLISLSGFAWLVFRR